MVLHASEVLPAFVDCLVVEGMAAVFACLLRLSLPRTRAPAAVARDGAPPGRTARPHSS